MSPSGTPFNGWQRSFALVTSIVLGLVMLLLCWQGAAAQAPAAPAGTVWFVNNQPGEGLAGYWKFDQVTNTTTVNSALLTNVATLANGASLSFTLLPPLGIPNLRKLSLNGTNQFLTVPDDPALDVAPDNFSLAVWARRTTTGTYDAIYDSGTETNKWWVFIADGSGIKANHFGFGVRGMTEVYSTASITDTNWHHLAVVVNGSGTNNLTFYVDGAARGVATAANILTPTGSKRIGALSDGGLFAQFAGDLDDLRLYHRALSAAEVARLALGRGCVTDGLSWAAAFADLQCALGVAASGDEIWVAKSLKPYRPGTNENARFNLVSGVGLFGNFQGNETSRSQRPPVNFELVGVTTLSGDLLDDDGTVGNSDNARNVVDANGTGPGTVFDSFRVQAGNNLELIGGGGGGLRLRTSGQLTVSNSLFIENQAAEAGGGLLASSGLIRLDNVIFDLNSAPLGGGAALLTDGVISGGEFVANSADECGGLIVTTGAVTVTSTLFDLNRAGAQGGGACNFGSLVLNGAVFRSNKAGAGGGLYATQAVTLTGSQFLTNTAGNGAGLFAEFGRPVSIHGGLFAGNTTTSTLGAGGAISATGSLALDGAQFQGNTASRGGAVALINGPLQITSTVFLANRATISDGGALWISQSGTLLTNVLLVGNQAAHQGGAIFMNQSGTTLAQLTAVSNTATVSGSVVFADNSGVQMFNSIVWRNGPGAIGRQSSGVSFTFNLGDAGISNTGNLSGNPRFVREPNPGDGDWTTLADNDYGDLRLTGASPAIDAGNNTLLTVSLATDLDGQPRFVDTAAVPDTGVGPAPIVDMGAYEFQLVLLFMSLLTR